MIALLTKLVSTLSVLVAMLVILAYANTYEENEQTPPPNTISSLPTIQELLMAAPTLRAQLGLWLIHTLLWYIVCNIIAYPIMFRFMDKMESKKQFIKIFAGIFRKNLGVDIGEGESALSLIAHASTCLVQHAAGGLLCMPSGFRMASFLPPGIAFSMARHGLLCELGFETQDSILRLYEIVFGGELGRSKNPPGLLIGLVLHHCASFCMVIPMNLHYPHDAKVHELSCLLQLAATIAISFQYYGYTLNVKIPADLSRMKISLSTSFATLMWSRGIRYLWLLWNIGWTIRVDENWFVFKLFCFPAVGLSLFNVMMVADTIVKMVKFLPMSIEKHPEDEIVDLATDAASAGTMLRRASSFFGLNKSQKEWAKIRGVVRMGVFHKAALHRTKEE